jgi:hypothetical protein
MLLSINKLSSKINVNPDEFDMYLLQCIINKYKIYYYNNFN